VYKCVQIAVTCQLYFPLPPHWVVLDFEHGDLHPEKRPLLAGVGKQQRTCTHVDNEVVAQDVVAVAVALPLQTSYTK
jgi:hypothetical protein